MLLLVYVANFPGQLHFRRSYFFKVSISSERLLLGKQFDTTVTFSEQLFLQSSYFFRSKLLPSSCIRMCSSIGQLLFQNNYFFRATFSMQVFLHCIKFFRISFFNKAASSKKITFQNSYFFRKAILHSAYFYHKRHLFIVANFSLSYIFVAVHFSEELQHTFSQEVLFHSYISFPQLQFPFIN